MKPALEELKEIMNEKFSTAEIANLRGWKEPHGGSVYESLTREVMLDLLFALVEHKDEKEHVLNLIEDFLAMMMEHEESLHDCGEHGFHEEDDETEDGKPN